MNQNNSLSIYDQQTCGWVQLDDSEDLLGSTRALESELNQMETLLN